MIKNNHGEALYEVFKDSGMNVCISIVNDCNATSNSKFTTFSMFKNKKELETKDIINAKPYGRRSKTKITKEMITVISDYEHESYTDKIAFEIVENGIKLSINNNSRILELKKGEVFSIIIYNNNIFILNDYKLNIYNKKLELIKEIEDSNYKFNFIHLFASAQIANHPIRIVAKRINNTEENFEFEVDKENLTLKRIEWSRGKN